MRLTARDQRLAKDIALSHVLSRDQILALGYFTSVTRANTRLRELRAEGIVRCIETPFFAQSLYSVGSNAEILLGDRIARIVAGRTGSPRFIQHALCITNVRLALLSKGASGWRFEQQIRCQFRHGGKDWEVRPDGLAVFPSGLFAVEVDLGHVAPSKFEEKLKAFDAFVTSGECSRHWKQPTFTLLTVTTGQLRASRLTSLVPKNCSFRFECRPFEKLGISYAGAWS